MALFDDYAVRRARGERPDVRAYLERAGEGAHELRGLLDRLLATTPPPPADEASVAAFESWVAGEPPLVALRARRGVKRDAIVDALIERLGLAREKREKVRRYYHQLESGLLEPARVSRRVYDVVSEAIGARVEELATWRPPPAAMEGAFLRADNRVAYELSLPAAAAAEPDEWDEVDELFRGGP